MNKNAIKSEEENIIISGDFHHYALVYYEFDYYWEDCIEAGSITLYNKCSDDFNKFTIWCGDDEGTHFYVCLPTGEQDEYGEMILEDYDIESFNIKVATYANLSNVDRLKAIRKISKVFKFSLPEAIKFLKNINNRHLLFTFTSEICICLNLEKI